MDNEFSEVFFDNIPIVSKDEADKLWVYALRISDLCDIPLLSALVPALKAIADVRKDGKM